MTRVNRGRISKKMLQTAVDNINYYTNHKVKIYFTDGCGVYLVIDGIEYNKQIDENTFTGISNKKAYEILGKYDGEIWQGYQKMKEKNKGGK